MYLCHSFLKNMDFLYEQRSGNFYLADIEDGRALVACGYSGKGQSRNNPVHQDRQALGPLPCGVWRIHPAITHKRLGPIAIPLTQTKGETFGRSAFYIHGDNSRGDYSASSGCIILPRDVRTFVSRSGIGTLTVVPG
ncbi:hypothetical protein [Citromicrobium phage vB_Cib_ssDNA_P1]|nr:hypothetical protein [Citromicrobium phage vB_Cib_ssDNA_P1]